MTRFTLFITLGVLLLVGCKGNSEPTVNTAPSVSGKVATTLYANHAWSFTPTATDAQNDALTFSVENAPSWLSFDTTSGHLYGKPTVYDVGQYANIIIRVSDGKLSTALAPFSLVVKTNDWSITSKPKTYTFINTPYQYHITTDSALGVNITAQNLPHWLTMNESTGVISGQATHDDLTSHTSPSKIHIEVSDHHKSLSNQFDLYLFDDVTTTNQCDEAHPPFDFTSIMSLYQQEKWHQASNRAALYLHNLSSAIARELSGKDVSMALIDTGVSLQHASACALTYRAKPISVEPLSHGSKMAAYALNYATQIDVLDYPITYEGYPASVIHQLLLDQPADIVNMSISAQNPKAPFDKNIADSLANLVRSGAIVSHSIGNLYQRKHDNSLEEIYTYSDITGKNEPTGDFIESYKLGHYYNFLPNITGYQDLQNSKGALVQVTAAVLDDDLSTIENQAVSSLNFSNVRAYFGHAKYSGITVIENGHGATSQATASFSAIMSLLIEHAKNLGIERTGRELVDIVFASATDIGAPGVDDVYGHGLVNIEAALVLLESGIVPEVPRGNLPPLSPSSFSELHEYLTQSYAK